VKRDIWDSALPFLERVRVSHNDIHEANIVISQGLHRARLIDFESCTGLQENDAALSPTFVSNTVRDTVARQKPLIAIDAICTAAVISCLWDRIVGDSQQNQTGRDKILLRFSKVSNQSKLMQEISEEIDS
jgi:serine/threonine protein kinase